MRIGPRYDSLVERIGAALNLVPVPVGLATKVKRLPQIPGLALLRAERTGTAAS